MKMQINILGTDYEFKHDESVLNLGADGLCKQYSKKIIVAPEKSMLSDDGDEHEKKERYNQVVRHEIIHAFFDEIGLDCYSSDEILVNMLSCQIPKMQKVFEKLGVDK